MAGEYKNRSEEYNDIKIVEVHDKEDKHLLKYHKCVKREFEEEIPWLKNFDLNVAKSLLILNSAELAGGVLSFDESPESEEILKVKEKMIGVGGIYSSCLYILEPFRGRGLWKELMRREIETASDSFVWGVVSHEHLIGLYKTLGAEIFDLENGLFIVKFTKEALLKAENKS